MLDRATRRDLWRIALLFIALVVVLVLSRDCGRATEDFLRALGPPADAGLTGSPTPRR